MVVNYFLYSATNAMRYSYNVIKKPRDCEFLEFLIAGRIHWILKLFIVLSICQQSKLTRFDHVLKFFKNCRIFNNRRLHNIKENIYT